MLARQRGYIPLAFLLLISVLLLFWTHSNSFHHIEDPILSQTYAERYSAYLSTLGPDASPSSEEIDDKRTLLEYLDGFRDEEIRESTYSHTPNIYDIIKEEDPSSSLFSDLSLFEKARYYSQQLLPKSAFKFEYADFYPFKDVLQPQEYYEKRLAKWEKIKDKFTPIEIEKLHLTDDEFANIMKSSLKRKQNTNIAMSNHVRNILTHYKFFSHIFLNDEMGKDDVNDEFWDNCSKASEKLFHFFTGAYPKFYRFNNDDTFLQYDPYKKEDNQLERKCFIRTLKNNLNGKGIVVTTTDGFVPQLAGLIALLRYQGVTYPMQIVYDKDLSMKAMKLLHTIATSDDLLLPELSGVSTEEPDFLPKLELSFVNVKGTLKDEYAHHYSSFGMKLQAYLFNTFEEMIMMDTDSVPFKSLNYFFESEEYQSTGAYFFKDRLMKSFILPEGINLIKPFLNYADELENLNITMTDGVVLNNEFFTSGTRHFMESGIITLNKREKFNGVLITYLSQMIDFLRHFSYGDKELIWLGQAIAGNTFTMNKHFAVSAGELTPQEISTVNEVCSTHPSHINEDMELLWTNSGIFVCKNWHEYEKDIHDERYKGFTEQELKEYYLSPMKFTHAIIPPDPFYKFHGVDEQVESGWRGSSLCGSYNWCAVEKVGGGLGGENVRSGRLISFTAQQTAQWSHYGLVWANHFNLASSNGDGRSTLHVAPQHADAFRGIHDVSRLLPY